jgi:hypothetical protein
VTDPTDQLHVDRLRLRVQGLDEAAARRLGRLVAENLAQDLRLTAGARVVDSLKLEVAGGPGSAPDELARRIAETLRSTLGSPSWGDAS